MKYLTKHCIICNKEYYVKEHASQSQTPSKINIRHSKAKTCSKKCSIIYNRQQTILKSKIRRLRLKIRKGKKWYLT